METNSEKGRINISATTYNEIKEFEKYLTELGFVTKDLRRTRRQLFREFKSLDELGWEPEALSDFNDHFQTVKSHISGCP